MADIRKEQLDNKLNYLYNTKHIFRNILEEQGAEISDEDTFRDYAEKIKTLNTGDVLLFETEQEMREYDNPKENILAVVYQPSSDNTDFSSYIKYIIFSKDVTLPQECINNYSAPVVNQNGEYVGNTYLTPENFYFYINDDINIEINYTSNDGINYTRLEDVINPIDVITPIRIEVYWREADWFRPFIRYETGYFGGLFKCIDGIFVSVINQFNLSASNQILTGYSAYGTSGLISGDGSYITNICTNEYISQYLPSIKNNNNVVGIIQKGTKAKSMEYVQKCQINIDSAFNNEFDSDDCVVQLASMNKLEVENSSADKTVIQNYLNAREKYNYAFIMNGTAYRLYLGYNYDTKEQMNDATGQYQTVPYQMTSLYAFIVNLETLRIYRTFVNTDTWAFVENGSGGNVLSYAYSTNSDCLVILSDLNGWGNTGGARIGLTTIATSGSRNTRYFTINYPSDYAYKKIDCTSYDNDQDCYYLSYLSANREWSQKSTKRICKLTPTGELSSIYESSENMLYISSLWSNYFKNVDSLICYTTDNKGTVLRNLNTGNEINLYGSVIYNSSYWGLDADNIYLSHKLTADSLNYNICRINRKTLVVEVIPETQSSSRISNAFYNYNRELCIFINNKIISLQGEVLANFIKSILNNPNISGIDKIDDYKYQSAFADYNLQISADKFVAEVPVYKYYNYSKITELPIKNDLCIITPSKTSSSTNNNGSYYKYQSLDITDIGSETEELQKRIIELQNQLTEAEMLSDIIRG